MDFRHQLKSNHVLALRADLPFKLKQQSAKRLDVGLEAVNIPQ